ncbi:MAG: hypothetical protein ACI4KO_03155 [Ruminiclostridium sp.]
MKIVLSAENKYKTVDNEEREREVTRIVERLVGKKYQQDVENKSNQKLE